MIVVSDSSPITNLIHIRREGLLRILFDRVLIPPAVHEELQRTHATLPDFINVVAPANRTLIHQLQETLDLGEAEAIALAIDLHANLILVDERIGGAAAVEKGLKVTGLLGVLVEAKKRELIPGVGSLISDLEQTAGFRLSKAAKPEALRLANESV